MIWGECPDCRFRSFPPFEVTVLSAQSILRTHFSRVRDWLKGCQGSLCLYLNAPSIFVVWQPGSLNKTVLLLATSVLKCFGFLRSPVRSVLRARTHTHTHGAMDSHFSHSTRGAVGGLGALLRGFSQRSIGLKLASPTKDRGDSGIGVGLLEMQGKLQDCICRKKVREVNCHSWKFNFRCELNGRIKKIHSSYYSGSVENWSECWIRGLEKRTFPLKTISQMKTKTWSKNDILDPRAQPCGCL